MTKKDVAQMTALQLQSVIHEETRFHFNGYKCKGFKYVRSTPAFHFFTNGTDSAGVMQIMKVKRVA